MTTYRAAKPTEYLASRCEICKDGHLLLIGDNGERLHELPEPAGMFRCDVPTVAETLTKPEGNGE